MDLSLKWKLAKDRHTQYAKTPLGEYVVEAGWMGWIDSGLFPKAGIAWSGPSTKSVEVAKRACERHYRRTVAKLLKEIGA